MKKWLLQKLVVFRFPLKVIPLVPANLIRLLRTGFSTFKSRPVATMPVSLGIEISGICNLRCKMCPSTDMKRKKGFMQLSEFKKIIDEAKPLYLGLSGYGEPLLNNDVFQMIEYAKSKRAAVNLISNGTLIDSRFADKIVESGLDVLKISIDGATKETFEKIRIGANFEEVIKNVKLIVESKKRHNSTKPLLVINTVLFVDNIHEAKDIIKLCKKEFNTYVEFMSMFTFDWNDKDAWVLPGSKLKYKKHIFAAMKEAKKYGFQVVVDNLEALLKSMENMYRDSSKGPCFVPWISLAVSWDGYAYPCCNFLNTAGTFGNVIEESVSRIWNNSAFRTFRSNLVKNRKMYKKCANCGMDDQGLYGLFRTIAKSMPPLRLLSRRKYL